jgi:CheY-like chemotaxis protein
MRAAADVYEVAVADDGIGIAPEFRQHVFDPFRQADGTTTRQYGGLGLGLAIVKELTALHGGSVAVESPGAGQGATFIVRMPALDATPTSAPPLSAAPIARALVGVRVLAVDDNADALDMLQLTLEQAGAVVRTAASGRQALDLYARETPDVLLCDLAMPDMDGFEVLRRLGDRPATPRVPAIAVSAHATDLHRARSVQAGFREHLAKPYPVEALIEVIQRVRSESSGEPRA